MSRAARLAALGAVAAALALGLALGPLEGVPHVPDEAAYALQARLFASGAWLGPTPADAEYVAQAFVRLEPGVHSAFPPGWSMLLAAGALVGATWLVNPLLCALVPALAFRLTLQVADEAAAWRAAAIGACSPGILLLASSQMAHTSTLVAGLLLACSALGALGPTAGGLAGAYLVLARPFEALVVGGPLLIALSWRRRSWQALVLPGLAAGVLLASNEWLTGDWATFPTRAWFLEQTPDRPGCDSLGFGADHGCSPLHGSYGHTPEKAWWTLRHNGQVYARLLLGSAPLALLALPGLVHLARRAPLTLWPLVLPLAYGFYWTQGIAYGARFYHLLYVVALPALGVSLARLRRPGWLVLLGCAWGYTRMSDELPGYWCADAAVAEGAAGRTGLLWYAAAGEREGRWPYVGTDAMQCDSATAWNAAIGQVPLDGALQIRAWPGDLAVARGYAQTFYGGDDAWAMGHDLAGDQTTVRPLFDEGTR